MYGLKAISAYNGWAMAIAGPLIVFAGLAILSLVISQLHKAVAILEHHEEKQKSALEAQRAAEERQKLIVPKPFPTDPREAAAFYQSLIDQIEQPFQLKELYEMAQKNNFPHPYLTVTGFREEGILVNVGEGLFSWNQ